MIIHTKNGFYTMSQHALERFVERNFTEEQIVQALENGIKEESESSGEDVYIYGNIGVVVDELDRIRTIFWID